MILWLDIETTGLNPLDHRICEVGWVITDNEFFRRSHGSVTMRAVDGPWHPDAYQMHLASGLVRAMQDIPDDAPGSCREAEQIILAGMNDYPASADWYLGGSSVHFDRSFLRVYMPLLHRRLHHRHVDVSAARLVLGVPFPTGAQPHRAILDVDASLRAATVLRDGFRKAVAR